MAQEFIRVMELAGVPFCMPDGVTPRDSPVLVNFRDLLARDTLIKDPPGQLRSDLKLIGWFDEKLDLLARLLRTGSDVG